MRAILFFQVARQEIHLHLSSAYPQEDRFRGWGSKTSQESGETTRRRSRQSRFQGGDVFRVWPHVSLPFGIPASCRRREKRDISGCQALQHFGWTRRAQVRASCCATLIIMPLTFSCRFALRPSSPVYGWWYYYMIFQAVGKTLGQVIPRFPPSSDDDVDFLLDMKVRV